MRLCDERTDPRAPLREKKITLVTSSHGKYLEVNFPVEGGHVISDSGYTAKRAVADLANPPSTGKLRYTDKKTHTVLYKQDLITSEIVVFFLGSNDNDVSGLTDPVESINNLKSLCSTTLECGAIPVLCTMEVRKVCRNTNYRTLYNSFHRQLKETRPGKQLTVADPALGGDFIIPIEDVHNFLPVEALKDDGIHFKEYILNKKLNNLLHILEKKYGRVPPYPACPAGIYEDAIFFFTKAYCFSNFFPCKFQHFVQIPEWNESTNQWSTSWYWFEFISTEQMYLFLKAMISAKIAVDSSKDYTTASNILGSQTSSQCKKFSYELTISPDDWAPVKVPIMMECQVCKYCFSTDSSYNLRQLNTSPELIVEDSPSDACWGTKEPQPTYHPSGSVTYNKKVSIARNLPSSMWTGENRLGNLLMSFRSFLRNCRKCNSVDKYKDVPTSFMDHRWADIFEKVKTSRDLVGPHYRPT